MPNQYTGPSSIEERFWPKVKKAGPDECWLWTGCCHTYGYGKILYNRKITHAHRVSYELQNGPIPEGLHVCHKCDNPPCVNPAHLFIGTNDDNRKDSKKKGRHAHGDNTMVRLYPELILRGEAHPFSKLTEDNVRSIRREYVRHTNGLQKLANKYGVTLMAVKNALSRKTWKHVT